MPDYPPIQFVDETDQIVGQGSMDEAHKLGICHRVVHILVFDTDGKVLMQKRGPHVATSPNQWDYSAGGHVDAGETYLQAGLRELKEELGLSGFKLEALYKIKRQSNSGWRIINRFAQLYKTIVPAGTKITIEDAELAEARWMTIVEVNQLIAAHGNEVTRGFQDDFKIVTKAT